MIGKIVKGTSFSGCVNYVLKEDKSRLLKAVGVYGSPEEIAEQFELQTLLNDKVKNFILVSIFLVFFFISIIR